MVTSQNGWPADSRAAADVATFVVPGTAVRLPVSRAAAPALMEFSRWWHVSVEPLNPGWCWGYAPRNIRGSSQVSNHASGTAVDLNAPRHPLGASGTVPPATRVAISAKATSLGLRWGGDYSGRKDEMHVEVVVSKTRMAQIVAALQRTPELPKEDDVKNLIIGHEKTNRATYVGNGIQCRHIKTPQELANLQAWVNRRGGDATDNEFADGTLLGVLGVVVNP